jgi:DNA-binding transcriptional LysR family regulator
MNLQELSTFIAVAQYKNFTKAAKELGLSQSAVSRQIKALEEQLGTQLLVRNPRQVLLTNKGTELYHRAVDFNSWVDKDFLQKEVKDLKIGSIEGFLHYWILPKLDQNFFSSWQRLELLTFKSGSMIDMVAGAELDGCFTTSNIQTELITSLKVYTERPVLITTDKDLNLKSLHQYPWVVFSDNDPLLLNTKNKSQNITRMNSLRAIFNTVSSGHGVAVVPEHMALDNPKLTIKRPKFLKPTGIYFNTLNKRKMDKHLVSFYELLLRD